MASVPRLLTGDDAARALAQLLQGEALIGVAAYPEPMGRRPASLQLLAAAGAEAALLIDVARCPGLAAAWTKAAVAPGGRPAGAAVAAYAAQPLQHALWRSNGGEPSRWASATLNEQLLGRGAGRGGEQDLAALAARYGQPVPPPMAGGLQALVQRAQAVLAIVRAQGQMLRAQGMERVSRLEAACVAPVARLERNGLPFSSELFGAQLARERAVLEQPANTEASRHEHEAIRRLQQHHGQGLLEHVEADGRMRATFVQIGASTGRMACKEPNLQGVPKGGQRRACFAASAGRMLVSADYAACELRILAQVSGDPDYRRAFAAGQDVHAEVAKRLFGAAGGVAALRAQREAAKMLSFGLIYGMQAPGLAKRLGQSVATAEQWLAQFFRSYPHLSDYLQASSEQSLARGHVTTLLGRRLTLPAGDRARALRLARNMPIQGTGADLAKDALRRTAAALAEDPRHLLVHAIHDSLMVECDQAAVPAMCDLLTQNMRAAGAALLPDIPIGVDTSACQHWL